MFEEMVDKQNNIIHISEEQFEKAKILAGGYGHQTKQSLQWWLSNVVSTAVDEAKQYTKQEFVIGANRFERFDNHYRNLRELLVTHQQLLNNEGLDNYHLVELYPQDQPHSGILPRMADLRELYERSQQLAEQTQESDQEFDRKWLHEWERTFEKDKPMMDQRMAAFERLHEQRNRSIEHNENATQLTSANVTGEAYDRLTSGSDIIAELRAELLNASFSGKVGSQVNIHLGQLTSATLDRHPEIGSILEEHGFRQGEFADQFYSQLSSENMSALANKLLLADLVEPITNVTGEAYDRPTSGSDIIAELRAELLNASCSGKVGSQVNSHLGQLTSATLDRHPEIGSILLSAFLLIYPGSDGDRLDT
jgi:hypothetical protein